MSSKRADSVGHARTDETRACALGTIKGVKILELNHVAVLVKDVEKSCEFYSNVLGLEQIPRPAFDFPGAWYRLGTEQELHIIGGRTEPTPLFDRGNHFALRTKDLGRWQEHLKRLGIEFRGPKPRPDGAMQIFLRDGDGHLIELFTPAPKS
jgi:lactoylglutathione lyase